ncbi:MAG: hypothetical protein ACR2P2_05105 [Nakamurella sp.]
MQTFVTCGRPPRSPLLRGLVQHLWYVSDPGAAGYELKLPTTSAQILINLTGGPLTARVVSGSNPTAAAVGPVGLSSIQPGAVVLDRTEQQRIAGVVIRPEAVGAVAGIPADRIDSLTGLADLWGSKVERLLTTAGPDRTGSETIDRIESTLEGTMLRRATADPLARDAVAALRQGMPVGQIGGRLDE